MFSASPDATIRIWSVPGASCVQVVRAHESAVTGLSLHATGDYLLSSSDDQVRQRPEKCMLRYLPCKGLHKMESAKQDDGVFIYSLQTPTLSSLSVLGLL